MSRGVVPEEPDRLGPGEVSQGRGGAVRLRVSQESGEVEVGAGGVGVGVAC